MANRANVLKSVHRMLERYEPLATYLGHVVGATSAPDGARVIGDSVHIDQLPLPIVVLGFEGGDAENPARDVSNWGLETLLYTEDIFQAAELLDLIEAACLDYRFDNSAPQPLNRVQAGPHQRLEPDTPQGRIIATRMSISVTWV